MGISFAQRVGKATVCACGCNESFNAFPTYRDKADGGGLRYPEYKRGHHPNCRKTQTGAKPAWNAGLTKADHPSIASMGFQLGHKPYNDWAAVNEALKNNPALRRKWLKSKLGQVAWNRGKERSDYPNGIASGPQHGNWKGGHRGIVDTAEWQRMRRSILRRDNYTCQKCGDRNRKGRGSRINLEVHHIIALCVSLELALEPSNLVTLCYLCHAKTHNYGGKSAKHRGN